MLTEPHERLADAAAAQGLIEVEVRERRAALASDPPDRAGALYSLALAHYRAGDRGAARRRVLEALEIAPTFDSALRLLLDLRREGKQPVDKVTRHCRAGECLPAGASPPGNHSRSGGTARLAPRFGAAGDASRLNRPPTGRNPHDWVRLHTPPVMKKARGCAIRVPGTVPLRCASRSGAGLKTGVPFPAAPSAWLASLRDCTYTATGTSFRSSLRFGRNTPGIPLSRALSAGRLAPLGAHATLPTGC